MHLPAGARAMAATCSPRHVGAQEHRGSDLAGELLRGERDAQAALAVPHEDSLLPIGKRT